MPNIIVAILSILILTLLVWVFNKIFTTKICPICAGVTLTWLWMLFGLWRGLISVPGNEFIVAILMGASIGGIVTEVKKMFQKFRSKAKKTEVGLLDDKLKDCC